MALADQQFRMGVLAGGAGLVAAITMLRFCGSVSLPPKPPPPTTPVGTQRELLTKANGSPAMYQEFLERDAKTVGVTPPTIEDMSRKFVYRVDESRHVLEPGQRPIDVAGLKLHVERFDDAITLVVENTLSSDVGYEVATTPSINPVACNNAQPQTYNAMVIARGGSETRVECVWRDGMSIAVTRVETMELPPLAAYYLSHASPALVGIEDRLARGHQAGEHAGAKSCPGIMPQVVRTHIDRGEITWRDLADFYARHRCETYRFPLKYRAFKSDNERELPAVEATP